MHDIELVLSSPLLLTTLSGIVGLMVGSFLNVVIYRLPLMMQKDWRQQCLTYLNLDPDKEDNPEPFNLMLPLSRCPECKTPIKPHQNIPVLSYIILKGRCSGCNTSISLRYPIIEALTGLCSAFVAWHFGYSIETACALLLTWNLIALSAIDIDHQLLPDSITLPLLWLGLFASIFGVFTHPEASIIGAIAGYLSLWTVYQTFKLLTGKEGMGYGDFKLLALFGAWLGWQYLPLIILFSALVGAIVGISMIIFHKRDKNVPIPYGPYLAAAGWIALLWGQQINQLYLNSVGL